MSQCRLKEQLLLFIGRLVLQGRDEHGVVKTELYVQYPNISYMFLGQSFMLKTYRSRLIVQKVGNLSVSLVPVVFTDGKKKYLCQYMEFCGYLFSISAMHYRTSSTRRLSFQREEAILSLRLSK